ncbi:mannose-6-phosphate isomerase, class I [Virgibacillus necropolis]|uniref:Mannose-6-phosphate isomerase n=1 Tax=Virgibacillus necropolis TaxID=163877 RepID=A0A221M9J0_9BACI|nr:mannose-6-phosphate isomerase, class I [Virgibacillus necropolis]ASN04313.1 mannose-6-phosphate isomerase, class I [Virgibacillus necropolis]
MYNEPIFLQPVFQERIWGGKKLRTEFNYPITSENTGEAWVISAHPNGPNRIANGPSEGKTLADIWKENGELFNKSSTNTEDYPLLVKILDANADLSVQVHPDDKFASEVEGQPYGKTECWYVLSADSDAEIILGHHANSRDELEQMLDSGQWEGLLQRIKVQAGDFIYVPSGTIHAIGKGIVILETQQSSDITYRVYDYDRVGADGQTRELHLDRAKEVTTVPHQPAGVHQTVKTIEGLTIKKLVKEKYFTVYHWQLDGKVNQRLENDFLQVSVIEGKAEITVDGNTFTIEKGSNFILPYTVKEYELSGNAEFVVSHT